MLGSMPKSRFFIPAPAINASKIPINDSPAIKPDDKRIPLWSILSGSPFVLFSDRMKWAITPPIRIGVERPKGDVVFIERFRKHKITAMGDSIAIRMAISRADVDHIYAPDNY